MSREEILKNIRRNKPDPIHLGEMDSEQWKSEKDLVTTFIRSLESVGGNVIVISNEPQIQENLHIMFPDARNIISLVDAIEISTMEKKDNISARDLEMLDLVVIEGQFGVSENGAVWISDKNIYHRSIPFITSHLCVVLKQTNIVDTMHAACTRISDFDEGYGVFISGPSKTADIEQSLVIGAQGALSLTVFVRL
jgi:L-lactate dehydrogenase complex protein LldG